MQKGTEAWENKKETAEEVGGTLSGLTAISSQPAVLNANKQQSSVRALMISLTNVELEMSGYTVKALKGPY